MSCERFGRVPLPRDALLGPSTLNVGTISGGRAPNVVADHAQAEIMFRTVGDPAEIREAGRRRRRGPRGSPRSLAYTCDSSCGLRRLADHNRGLHHGHSDIGQRVGQTISDRTGQHPSWRTPRKSASRKKNCRKRWRFTREWSRTFFARSGCRKGRSAMRLGLAIVGLRKDGAADRAARAGIWFRGAREIR